MGANAVFFFFFVYVFSDTSFFFIIPFGIGLGPPLRVNGALINGPKAVKSRVPVPIDFKLLTVIIFRWGFSPGLFVRTNDSFFFIGHHSYPPNVFEGC